MFHTNFLGFFCSYFTWNVIKCLCCWRAILQNYAIHWTNELPKPQINLEIFGLVDVFAFPVNYSFEFRILLCILTS